MSADAELKVRLSGDASDLEGTIRQVEKQLGSLNAMSGKGLKSMAAMTAKNGGFAKMVERSKEALTKKKEALAKTEKEYAKNTKAINDTITGLKQQKKEISDVVKSKKDEIKVLKDGNAGLSASSKEYKSNSKAIAAAQRELNNYERKGREVRKNISGQYTALQEQKAALEQSRNAVSSAYKQYNQFSKSLDTMEKLEKAIKWEETGQSVKEAGENIDTVTKPFQRLAAVTAAGAVASAKFAIDFENNFANVEKTVDGTDQQLNKIKQDIIDMATVGINGHSAIPQTTAELTELAAAGGQLGIQVENISGFTEVMAMIGSATNLYGEAGAKTLARFMNVANVSQEEVQNLGSSVVDLGNRFATTEAEIADMAMYMSATGTAVGISAQDILAYSTALSSLGAEAASGGSAVSRIWMDIQSAVSKGGKSLSTFAQMSGKSSAQFAADWKSNASSAFKDLLVQLSKSKDLVGDLQKLGFENIRDMQALQKLAGPTGIQLLNDALDRSNKAWDENTALVNEFESKAGKTAGQIAVMKNNLVEAGRSLGEAFLPSINNGITDVKNFAQWIANLDDNGKQTMLTVGKFAIGLGVFSKVAASGVKGVGNIVEAVGKLKAAGALAKVAPAMTKIGAAAPYAAAGIAAVTAAVVVGKSAYDAWYRSNYAWSEGLAEGNKTVKTSLDKYKQLSDIQGRIKTLKLTIESPDSSKEQVDEAKTKLEEIKGILSKEYNLVINTDNSNLESAVETVKGLSKNDLAENWIKQQRKLTALQGDFDDYQKDYAEAYQKYETALTDTKKYSDAQRKLSALRNSGKEVAQYAEEIRAIYRDLGMDDTDSAAMDVLDTRFSLNFRKAERDLEGYRNKVKSLTAASEEYIAVSTEMANWASEGIKIAVQAGDAEEANEWFNELSETIGRAKLNMHDYAQVAAEAFNGISWKAAWEKGGDAINNMVDDYIRSMQKFGAESGEIAKGAALLKNGFRSIGDIPKDNKQAFDAVSKDLTQFARSLGEIDGDHSIKITAGGNIALINDAAQQIEKIKNENGVEVQIQADGDIQILNEATNEATILSGLGEVHLTVNADGNIDILDEANQKIATIDKKTGQITVNGDYEGAQEIQQAIDNQNAVLDKDVHQIVTGLFPGKDEIAAALDYQNLLADKFVTYKVRHVVEGAPYRQAKGTRDFEGGTAMINDQRGVSDPRELVEVDGKGYIFEGRDVVLPLPKHAKVYTAGQTKEIMHRAGIPHYAGGKNNEEWESIKADWTHYNKTHDVTPSEKLEHWDNMLLKFKNDAEVVKEIQEEIFAATKDQWTEDLNSMRWYFEIGVTSAEEYYQRLEQYRDEHFKGDSEQWRNATKELYRYGKEHADALNLISEEYLSYHNAVNDWAEVGDTQTAAYDRIRERARQDVEKGYFTEKESADYLKKVGENMLDERIAQSETWMTHQKEYCNMSVKDEVAALDRMLGYTEEYYSKGMIGYEKYLTQRQELRERRMDAYAEGIDSWRSDADFYQRQSEVFGWGFNGTGHQSKESYWKARLDRELANAQDLNLSDSQRQNALRYADEARMEIYQARDESLNQFLQDFQKEMEEFRKMRDEEVQKLREAWTDTDRKKDIKETERELNLYRNAQTKEGQEKYKQLTEELERLQREETVAQMEAETQRQLEAMNAEYERMESAKANELAGLKDDLLRYSGDQIAALNDVQAIVDRAVDNAAEIAESMSGIEQQIAGISEILSALQTPSVINNYDYSPSVYNNIADRFAADVLSANLENGAMKFFGRVG